MSGGGFLGGEGGLERLGLLLSGVDAAVTGNPTALQANLVMGDEFRRMRERQDAARREQAQSDIVSAMMRERAAGTGTPATRSFQYGGRTIGQNNAAQPDVMVAPARMQMLQAGLGPAFNAAALQAKLAQVFAPSRDPLVLAEGARAFDEAGNVIASNPKAAPQAYKEGEIRDFTVGNRIVPHAYSRGQWKPVPGMGGPRWEDPRAPQEPWNADLIREQATRERQKADREQRADQAAYEAADYAFQQLLDTTESIRSDPALNSVIGVMDANTPNLREGARAVAAKIENLKSKLGMAAIQAARQGSASGATGFGALSENELTLLLNAIQALDPYGSEEAFLNQLAEIDKYAAKNQSILRNARGIIGSDVDDLLNKYAPR